MTSLPELPTNINRHSKPGGTLDRYQSQYTKKFDKVIVQIRISTQALSSEINQQLRLLMNDFTQKRMQISQTRSELLSNMKTSTLNLEEIHTKLLEIGDELVMECRKLRDQSISEYDSALPRLQPIIQLAYDQCDSYYNKLPTQVHEKLPCEVQRINYQFLETKQQLLDVLYQIEESIEHENAQSEASFEQQIQSWSSNRYENLIRRSLETLSYTNAIDFTDIIYHFNSEEKKFANCHQKILNDINLIETPDKFTDSDIANWWTQASDILQYHHNFISQIDADIRSRVNQRLESNRSLISSLQEEIPQLVEDSEEILTQFDPIFKTTELYYESFGSKLSTFWINRENALSRAYDSIKSFLDSIVHEYNSIFRSCEELKAEYSKMNEDKEQEVAESLANLEKELSSCIAEINEAPTEKEISSGVKKAQEILGKIESLYRLKYSQCIEICDAIQSKVSPMFESTEQRVMDILKMSKEMEVFQPKVKEPRSARRNPRRKTPRKIAGNGLKFYVNNACFSEIEPVVIIPQFPPFVDESFAESDLAKSKAKKPKPPPKKKPKIEDPETPIFNLQDVFYVEFFIPENSSLAEYVRKIRTGVLTDISNLRKECEEWSLLTERRALLAEELNESLRVHAPRSGDIEVNIASARLNAIESKNYALQKFVKQAVNERKKSIFEAEETLNKFEREYKSKASDLERFVKKMFEMENRAQLSELQILQRIGVKQFNESFSIAQKQMEEMINAIEIKCNFDSEDEDKMLERLEAQVSEAVNKLRMRLDEIINIVNDEAETHIKTFESTLSHHEDDLEIIEKIQKAEESASQQFRGLYLKNKESEAKIQRILDQVKEAQTLNLPYLTLMSKQLEVLDIARIELIKRAKYLDALKSDISQDPVPIDIDFGCSESVFETQRSTIRKKGITAQKSIRTIIRMKRQETVTLMSQAKTIGNDLVMQLTPSVTLFYSKVAGRHAEITRPDKLPPSVPKCLDMIKMTWSQTCANLREIMEESKGVLGNQVISAVSIIKKSVEVVFGSVRKYYESFFDDASSINQLMLETTFNDLYKRAEEHRKMMNPSICDRNKEEQFYALLEEEKDRQNEEKEAIISLHNNFVEKVNQCVTQFSNQMPQVTEAVLKLFDAFVQVEDLVGFNIPNADRKPLVSVIREQARKDNNPSNSDGRPFQSSEWDLGVFLPENILTKISVDEQQQKESRGKKHRTTRQIKETDSARLSGNVTMKSLETEIHREVIKWTELSKKNFFNSYNRCVDEFNDVEFELNQKKDQFADFWVRTVTSLKPGIEMP